MDPTTSAAPPAAAAASTEPAVIPPLVYLGPHDNVENCRFYEQKYPKLEDNVMVRVKNITETAAYVLLLEYNNVEGMIPLSELSRRGRIRSISQHIRIGRLEVVQVLRVDNDKGYIDLSKKKVMADDLKACELRFNKAKDVHSIMQHTARECRIQLESLYQHIAWPLYQKYGHAYDAFGIAYNDPEKVLGPLNLPGDVYEKLVNTIRHRHKVQPFRIRADVEVTCFKYEGIDAIREALMAGERVCATAGSVEGDAENITIRLLAAPTYVIIGSALDKEAGLARVEKSIQSIREVITAKGGNLKVVKAAAVVSTEDEFKQADSEESGEEKEGEEEEEGEEGEEDEEDEEADENGGDEEGEEEDEEE